MNIKLILASIVSGVVFFFGGWVIFGIALKDLYPSHTVAAAKPLMINPPNFGTLIASNLLFGFLISWLLQQTNNTTIIKGLFTALWFNALMCLSFDLLGASFMNMYTELPGFFATDVIAHAVLGGLAGIGAAVVLGSGKKATA